MPTRESNGGLSTLDYAILYYVWQNRILTTRHFINKFWPGVKENEASRNLSRFVKRRWLNRYPIPWIKEKFLYTSCRFGNRALIDLGLILPKYLNDFPRSQNDFSESIKHDLQVVDVRIAFERSGLIDSWISDHQLRLARRKDGITSRVPDAYFKMETSGESIDMILELERNTYRQRKFQTILDRLRAYFPHTTVIFVVQTNGRIHTLSNWARKDAFWNENMKKMIFCTYQAAYVDGLAAQFIDLDGQTPIWRVA